VVIDEFASRFVFFYSGYVLAQPAFRLASLSERHVLAAVAGMALWFLLNGALVHADLAERPVISLALGFLGAGVIVALSALLARRGLATFIRFCGENSLPIYLAFFLPMAFDARPDQHIRADHRRRRGSRDRHRGGRRRRACDPSARFADAAALPVRTPGCVSAQATTASRRAAVRGSGPQLTRR
jgi:hypothetical protein